MRVLVGLALIFGLTLFAISCGGDGEEGPTISMPPSVTAFDREALLTSWADNIIIPAFDNYTDNVRALALAKDDFISSPSTQSLETLRASWLKAYKSWQSVAMFDIGKAEEIGLRNFTNTFPVDKDAVDTNINSQEYNLLLPSSRSAQGLSALDYILYGLADSDDSIVNTLSSTDGSQYLDDVVSRLLELTESVSIDWTGGYRDVFIANSGSSATASTDKLVNDFLFYYEAFFRAGKVGIPAGVFSGSSLSGNVEAPYSGIYSKDLLLESLTAIENFFRGVSNTTGQDGLGLDNYLAHVATQNQTSDISGAIIDQLAIVRTKINNLDNNLFSQVESDNVKMLETYDEMQKAVVLLKVDMLQALNIQVDFVDADGD